MVVVFITLFTQPVKYPVTYLVYHYRLTAQGWTQGRVEFRELEPAVAEFCRAWPALVQKRPLLAAQRRELLRLRRAV